MTPETTRFQLFTNGYRNVKIAKSNKAGKGFFTLMLSLAPGKESGYQVCPFSSAGCRRGCLYTAGRGHYPVVVEGRIRKTKLYHEHNAEFRALALADLYKLLRVCKANDLQPAVRLNGTSDIEWETEWPELFELFPMIQFYDYAKDPNRFDYFHYLPDNYYLTFSRSEANEDLALQILRAGRANVAVVFEKELPKYWCGYPVYNADDDDLRFLDSKRGGAVAGLYAKGKARTDTTGFVIRQPVPWVSV